MAIAFVQQASNVETNNQTNLNTIQLTGVTAGNCLAVAAAIYNSSTSFTITGISDGTAYTVRSSVLTGGGYRQYNTIAYLPNAGSGTHTVTISLTGQNTDCYAVVGLAEFSGVLTASPEDVWDANDNTSITSNDINAGPITTTVAGDLLIGCAGLSADSATSLAWSSPSSWSSFMRQNDGFTSGTGVDAAFWIPGSIQTAYTPQWAHRNISGGLGSGVVVALKPAVAGANNLRSMMNHYQ